MKNVFHRSISRLDVAEERIYELKGISTELSKMEKQGEKRLKKKMKQNSQKMGENFRRCNTHIMGIPGREKRARKNNN